MNTNSPEPKFNIREYLYHLFDIRQGTSKAGTIQDIKDGISIQGHTAWILIFSILIASIGLNVSSTAVVIGAMLIAPLMGPLLGIGLSLATNDVHTLKRSFINLLGMVGISLTTSFLFFSIPLFQEATPELLARTKPDLRDVLIAIGGGLALIVSLSRRKEMTNTIAGVAIATALMPPLCTAGYGLATRNSSYFFGAMFIFIINSTYISLATFVILKFLRFRAVKKTDEKQKKYVFRWALLISTLILVMSIYTFYQLILEKNFRHNAKAFISYLKNKGVSLIDIDDEDLDYTHHKITITVFGSTITPDEQREWTTWMQSHGLAGTTLDIQQSKEYDELKMSLQELENTYAEQIKHIENKDEMLQKKDLLINELKQRIQTLTAQKVPFEKLSKEAKINYDGLLYMSYSPKIYTDFNRQDTIREFITGWNKRNRNRKKDFEKMKNWLRLRMAPDSISVIYQEK